MGEQPLGLKLRGGELKRLGRNEVERHLREQVTPVIQKTNLENGAPFFEADYGKKECLAWANRHFGLGMTAADVAAAPDEADQLTRFLVDRARQVYARREVEFPVRVGFSRYMAEQSDSYADRYDKEGLLAWASSRFAAPIEPVDYRNLSKKETFEKLLKVSEAYSADGRWDELDKELGLHLQPNAKDVPAEKLEPLVEWARRRYGADPGFEPRPHTYDEVRAKLLELANHKYRPELFEAEKMMLLQYLDMGWKDHLYAMDHLRQGIGLVGYAQIDPKVEYKRQGRKLFDEMWSHYDDKVTNLLFHLETYEENIQRNIWNITNVSHAEIEPGGYGDADGIAGQQNDAIEASKGDGKVEPIRNRSQKVGRNEPCPCGSGKKYKSCHGRGGNAA